MPADPQKRDRHQQVRSIYLTARDLEGEEQKIYLDEACGDDAELRAAVKKLLASETPAGDGSDGLPPLPKVSDAALGDPKQIGSFKILGLLGKGGMGRVFLAERTQHPRDQVALKLVRTGIADEKKAIASFMAEQKALSVLNHANIAHLYEAGTTDDGRPYFTMEYVPGVPITEYCELNELTVDERLAIFREVCDAITHVHKRNIIHRDIKPTNILVSSQDGKPVPKIIDFGIAKALHYSLSNQTLFEDGYIPGTPEYMSPEQAGRTSAVVDHRTDLYALGVLLYELLAGVTPIDSDTLRNAAREEMCRLIREFEPPSPSKRRRELAAHDTPQTRHRGTDLRAIPTGRRRDLDEITLRALEKSPSRRYQSAAEFSEAIKSYLDREPPPFSKYFWSRVRRQVRRHRRAYASVAVLLLALVLVGPLAWISMGSTNAETLYDKARTWHDNGHYDECVHDATDALKFEPTEPKILYLKMLCLTKRWEELRSAERERQRGLLRDALRLSQKYSEDVGSAIDDYNWKFRVLKCSTLLELKPIDLAAAEEACTDAYKSPGTPDEDAWRGAMYLAVLRALENQFDSALSLAKEAAPVKLVEKDKNADEANRLLGTLYLHLHDPVRARQALNAAYQTNKKDARNTTMMARYHLLETRDYKTAYDFATQAITHEWYTPYYERVHALAYLRNGQWRKAAETARDGLRDDEVPSFRYLIVAIAEAQRGQLDEAKKYLNQAIAPDTWPSDLEDRGAIPSYDIEFLWIEYYGELKALRDEAETLIRDGGE